MEREHKIPVVRAALRIEALAMADHIAEHLSEVRGCVALLVERISYTVSDNPVYFQRRYHRADRVAFDLHLERGRPRGTVRTRRPATPGHFARREA